MIASIALANNLILLTHNTREFSRVEGLRLEDWEIEAGVELLENDGVIALENMQLRSS